MGQNSKTSASAVVMAWAPDFGDNHMESFASEKDATEALAKLLGIHPPVDAQYNSGFAERVDRAYDASGWKFLHIGVMDMENGKIATLETSPETRPGWECRVMMLEEVADDTAGWPEIIDETARQFDYRVAAFSDAPDAVQNRIGHGHEYAVWSDRNQAGGHMFGSHDPQQALVALAVRLSLDEDDLRAAVDRAQTAEMEPG